jgi:hypothetical protein
MSENISKLKIYADAECTQLISTIGWSNFIKIKLVNGTEKMLLNSARGGENATATVWIKNESTMDFGITEISFSDSRVQVILSEAWVYPQRPVQMTLVFSVPDKPTEKDIIEAGKINIQGYFISKTQVS